MSGKGPSLSRLLASFTPEQREAFERMWGTTDQRPDAAAETSGPPVASPPASDLREES